MSTKRLRDTKKITSKKTKQQDPIVAIQNKVFLWINVGALFWTLLVVIFAIDKKIEYQKMSTDLVIVQAESVYKTNVLIDRVINQVNTNKQPFEKLFQDYVDSLNNIDLSLLTNSKEVHFFLSLISAELQRISNLTSFESHLIIASDNSQQRLTRWEKTAIEALEEKKDAIYVDDLQDINGLVRIMMPLDVTKKMLTDKNFSQTFINYKEGDFLAGIAVLVPAQTVIGFMQDKLSALFVSLAVLWAIILVIIYVLGRKYLIHLSKYYQLKFKISDVKESSYTHTEDVTAELEEAVRKMEHENYLKGQFFSSISHEIRTPLNGVLGMSELLLRTDLTDEQASFVAYLRASAKSLLDTFNDIWDYSQLETNKIEIDSYSFSLRDIIYDIVTTYTPQATVKGIKLTTLIAPQVPDNLIGDGARIKQVVTNLVSNAVKYTDYGEVTFTISNVHLELDMVQLSFVIKDTGIGIPDEKQKVLLLKRQNVDLSTRRKADGLGLGLMISSSLSELMGGHLDFISKEGKGSEFTFSIELAYLAEVQSTRNKIHTDILKDVHVLIVDDNTTNRVILVEQLKAWEMRPTECASVDEALRLLTIAATSFSPFSIVLTDLQMPERDGVDLAQAMKRNHNLASIPVILLSSSLAYSDLEEDLFFARLFKPTRPTELLRILTSAINKKESQGEEIVPSTEQQKVTPEHVYRLLLVEDLEVNKFVLTQLLTGLGHEVYNAKNGADALDMIAQYDFDIVFMDIHMPVMDGIEAIERIRKNELNSKTNEHLPVIAVTTSVLPSNKRDYFLAGMDDYILKPVTILELHTTIEKIAKKFNLIPRKRTQKKEMVNLAKDALNPTITDGNQTIKEIQLLSESQTLSEKKLQEVASSYSTPSIVTHTSELEKTERKESSSPTIKPIEGGSAAYGQPSVKNAQEQNSPLESACDKLQNSAIIPAVSINSATQILNDSEKLINVSDDGLEGTESVMHRSSGKLRKVLPPLELDALTKAFSSYPDLAIKSMEIFLRDAPKLIIDIKEAVEHGDNNAFRVSSHSLKGLVAYYTKGLIYKTCLNLEYMGRDKELPDHKEKAEKLFIQLNEEFDKMMIALKAYME